MKIKSIIAIVITLALISVNNISSQQQNREQKIGKPKKSKNITFMLKGEVRSKKSNEIVPNADITVKEMTQQKVITRKQANAAGNYEVIIPKGLDIEVKAQAPDLFFDAFKIKVNIEDTTTILNHNFILPSELSLRLNFPTDKYNDPYPYILDDNGKESMDRWQSAIDLVAEDLIKYQDYIEKVILVGHTDDVGKADYNLKLGQNRVEFVRDELQKRGVPSGIMEVRSAGKNELLEKRPGEDTDFWRTRCRRVVMNKFMKKR